MKKIAVLLPVIILAIIYFQARFHGDYAVAGLRGKASLAFGLGIMFLVMIIGVYRKKKRNFFAGVHTVKFSCLRIHGINADRLFYAFQGSGGTWLVAEGFASHADKGKNKYATFPDV